MGKLNKTRKKGFMQFVRQRVVKGKKTTKVTNRAMDSTLYRKFSRQVHKRDGGLCLMCKFIDGDLNKKRCNIHHIEKWTEAIDERYNPKNGILLCFFHHKRITGWEVQFSKALKELVAKSEAEYVEKNNSDPYAE